MKKLFALAVIILCFSSISSYSQSTDSFLEETTTFDFIPINFKSTNKTPPLSLYNKTTRAYDNYNVMGGNYVLSNPSFFYVNEPQFLSDIYTGRNFLKQNNPLAQNNYFSSNYNSTYIIRDSFNPYGASNISEALLGGLLGMIFK